MLVNMHHAWQITEKLTFSAMSRSLSCGWDDLSSYKGLGGINSQVPNFLLISSSLKIDSLNVSNSIWRTNKRNRRNKETNGQTPPAIEVGAFVRALKCDIWWQYFNNFPHDKLTKFCVFIGWSRILISSSLKFLRSIALRPPKRWTPLTDTTDKQTEK